MKGKEFKKKISVFFLTLMMLFSSFAGNGLTRIVQAQDSDEGKIQPFCVEKQVTLTKCFEGSTNLHATIRINGAIWNANGNSNTYTKNIEVEKEYIISETPPAGYSGVPDFTIKFVPFGHNNYKLTVVGQIPDGVSITNGDHFEIMNTLSERKFDLEKVFERIDGRNPSSFPTFMITYPDASTAAYSSTNGSYNDITLKVGDNTFIETNVPQGYVGITSFVIHMDRNGTLTSPNLPVGVTIYNQSDKVKINNSLIQKEIHLVKTYEGAHSTNAKFKVNGDWISSSNGIYEDITFKYGSEYTFAEYFVPDGYVGASSFKLKLDAAGNLVSVGALPSGVSISGDTVTVFNPYITKEINIVKTDGVTEICGASFTLNGNAMQVSDGGNRFTAYINNVIEYTVSETAPAGHIGAADFKVKLNSARTALIPVGNLPIGVSINGLVITVANAKMTNTMNIIKKDGTDLLPGASFSINGNAAAADANGSAFSAQVVYGTVYTVSETAAPNGYTGVSDFKVKLSDDGQSLLAVDGLPAGVSIEGMTVTVNNDPNQFNITVVKTDGENPLSGAAFTIDGQAMNAIEAASFSAVMDYGKPYTIHESTVPTGYSGVADFAVRIKADQTGLEAVGEFPNGVSIDGFTITVENAKLTNTVTILKKEGESLLSGASFKLNGIAADENEQGNTFTSLIEWGNSYTISETAPTGYNGVSDFSIALSDDGQSLVYESLPDGVSIEGMVITVNNNKIVKPITITKTDGFKLLSGAMFTLNSENMIPDASGSYFSGALTYGTVYTVSETVVPAGYEPLPDFRIKLGDDGQSIVPVGDLPEGVSIDGSFIVVANAKITNSITILKTDGEVALPGASFTISGQEADRKDDQSTFTAVLTHGTVYTISESVVPTGYTGVSDFQVALSDDGKSLIYEGLPDGVSIEGLVITVENELIGNEFKIVKTDGEKLLSGAAFTVTEDSMVQIAAVNKNIDVDEAGSTFTTDIEFGKIYTVHESTVPTGYTGVSDFQVMLSSDGLSLIPVQFYPQAFTMIENPLPEGVSIEGLTITVENTLNTNTVKILKTDGESPLSGAYFTISDEDVLVSKDGCTFSALLECNTIYTIDECVVPAGFVGCADFQVKLSDDGQSLVAMGELPKGISIEGLEITVVNDPEEPVQSEITILKTDGEAALAGAEFVVDGEKAKADESGTEFTATLEAGKAYKVSESVVPTGYIGAEDFEVALSEDGQSLVAEKLPEGISIERLEITVVNTKIEPIQSKITILKTDGKFALVGAEFVVDGEKAKADESGTEFTATLEAGKAYKVSESVVPTGYIGAEDFEIALSEDGQSLVAEKLPEGVSIEGLTITVANKLITADIKIMKTDGQSLLPGASFMIGGKDIKSEKDGCTFITNLEYNNVYTIYENEVPEGYVGTESFEVTLSDDGQSLVAVGELPKGISIEGLEITVVNTKIEPIQSEITILKTDGEAALAGAEFVVDGEKAKADESGTEFTATLEAGKAYKVSESVVPTGYIGAEDFEVALSEDGQSLVAEKLPEGVSIEGLTITVANTLRTNILTINKTDGKNLLAGAMFTIEDLTIHIDEDGSLFSALVSYGTEYTVHESIVPVGYTGVADFIVALSEDGESLEAVGKLPKGVTIDGMNITVVNTLVPTDPKDPDVPDTGDSMTLPAMILLLGMSGLGTLYVLKKRRTTNL